MALQPCQEHDLLKSPHQLSTALSQGCRTTFEASQYMLLVLPRSVNEVAKARCHQLLPAQVAHTVLRVHTTSSTACLTAIPMQVHVSLHSCCRMERLVKSCASETALC